MYSIAVSGQECRIFVQARSFAIAPLCGRSRSCKDAVPLIAYRGDGGPPARLHLGKINRRFFEKLDKILLFHAVDIGILDADLFLFHKFHEGVI
ncbi:hypothetical protein BMS3Bbin14_01924 [bacterium BMS3Bbin14]|nr:hypothetical protein BMS3Abin13_01287 [bacterium BMS3Abin13]GBE53430.1 hypothetical protein BMS3Bbin14_01924 [bacterium BMS3Bbin14]